MKITNNGNGSGAALLLSLAMVMACAEGNVLGPDNQLEVANPADNFQFQVSNMDRVTETLTYTWENTGTQATVDISQAITEGNALLVISDADGTLVHQDDIASDNDTDTAVGVPGTWTIEIRIQQASGTFNFRVQKKT